jgi:uncharacterized protein with PIN domain
MACNEPLRPAVKAGILDRVPARIAECHEEFHEC